VDLRVAALKIGEHVWQKIEAGGFVGAEDERSLDDVTAVGNDLDGLVAETQKALGVFEKDFAGRRELDGLGGSVQKAGTIGLFELANLRADSGLRTENFLPGAREAL
jgi:hypothetical protein